MRLRGFRKQLTVKNHTIIADQATDEVSKDTVLGWCPMPAGSTLLGIWMNIQAVSSTDLAADQATPISLNGFMVPYTDPDSAIADPDQLWDVVVPKVQERDASMVDLDLVTTADTEAAEGYTEIRFDKMMDLQGPVELYRDQKIITIQSPGSFIPGGASTAVYRAAFTRRGKIEKNVNTPVPAVAMIALGTVELPDDLNLYTGALTQWAPLNEEDWMRLTWPQLALRNAFEVAALAEADAGEPAAALDQFTRWLKYTQMDLDDYIESRAWIIISQFTFDVLFPEEPDFSQVST